MICNILGHGVKVYEDNTEFYDFVNQLATAFSTR